MKRFFCLFCCLILTLSLAACSLYEKEESMPDKTKVPKTTASGETSESTTSEVPDDPDDPDPVQEAAFALPSAESSFYDIPDALLSESVTDAESALLFLSQMKEAVGFFDISEFEAGQTEETDMGYCYRFHQMLDGMPVEGARLSIVTDNEGDVIRLSGRYRDPAKIDTRVIISQEESFDAVRKVVKDPSLTVMSLGNVIYMNGENGQAAWKNLLFGEDGIAIAYISAADGAFISGKVPEHTDRTAATSKDLSGNEVTIPVDERNSVYFLEDSRTYTRLYDMSSSKGTPNLIIRTGFYAEDYYSFPRGDIRSQKRESDDGGYWYRILHNKVEEAGIEYRLEISNSRACITANGSVIAENVQPEFIFYNDKTEMLPVISDKNNKWSQKAATAMARVQECYRFYNELFQRPGYAGKYSPLSVLINNRSDDYNWLDWLARQKDNNAGAYTFDFPGNVFACKITITPDSDILLDTLAHEYTHAVIDCYTDLGGSYEYREAAALNEGLADIMGECAEYYINQSCDWDHPSAKRSLIHPSYDEGVGKNTPMKYYGDGWYYGDDNNKFGHHNMTVISHLGYLIASGDLKDPAGCEALGALLTARLIYYTFPELEDDTGFADYATILYDMALRMYDYGLLSQKQVLCIAHALEEVGLLPVFRRWINKNLDLKAITGADLDTYEITIQVNSVTVLDGKAVYTCGDTTHFTVNNDPDFSPAFPDLGLQPGDDVYYRVSVITDAGSGQYFSFIISSKKLTIGSEASRWEIVTPLSPGEPVLNNGGRFVEYKGNTYYWKYNKNSLSREAGNASFYDQPNAVNELVVRNADGEESVIYKGTGCGNLFISGDRLYFLKKKYYDWAAIDLDGKNEYAMSGKEVVGACPELGIAVFRKDNELYAINRKDKEIRISADGSRTNSSSSVKLLFIKDAKAYYLRTESTKNANLITLYESNLISFKTRSFGTAEVADYGTGGSVGITYGAAVGNGRIYVSTAVATGRVQGINRSSLVSFALHGKADPQMVISAKDTYALGHWFLHYMEGEEPDDPGKLLFYSLAEDHPMYINSQQGAYGIDESIVSELDLKDGSIRPSSLPLLYPGYIALINQTDSHSLPDIACYDENGRSLRIVTTASMLTSFGLSVDGIETMNGCFIRYADIVGDKAYLEFWEIEKAPEQSSMMYTTYTLKSAKVFEVDMNSKNKKMELLYQH